MVSFPLQPQTRMDWAQILTSVHQRPWSEICCKLQFCSKLSKNTGCFIMRIFFFIFYINFEAQRSLLHPQLYCIHCWVYIFLHRAISITCRCNIVQLICKVLCDWCDMCKQADRVRNALADTFWWQFSVNLSASCCLT